MADNYANDGISDDSSDAQDDLLYSMMEDPRTLSQIRRSRIDPEQRYVFLCPNLLNKHFDVIPAQVRDAAILVFRCNRSFIFQDPPEVRSQRMKSRVDTGLQRRKVNGRHRSQSPGGSSCAPLYRDDFTKEFKQWLLIKERERCVFYFKPAQNLSKLSAFFEEQTDLATDRSYRPLLLDSQWWRVRFAPSNARFVLSPKPILAAISAMEANLDKRDVPIEAMQELIYQSNPSLEPIAKWPYAPSMRFLPNTVINRDASSKHAAFYGYINVDTCPNADAAGAGHSRINHWPEVPRERLDDLHRVWLRDDALSAKRDHLKLHGQSTLCPLRLR